MSIRGHNHLSAQGEKGTFVLKVLADNRLHQWAFLAVKWQYAMADEAVLGGCELPPAETVP